ncbi:hypothetical protein ACFLTU_08450 [Bacteroidota bacterium]
MKRKFPMLFSGIISLIMVFSACEKVVFPPPDNSFPDNISYSNTIQPIWDSKCVSCHGGSKAPDLRPNDSHGALTGGGYINTSDPAESDLMLKLYGSHDSRATQSEKTLILGWITQGAKDN